MFELSELCLSLRGRMILNSASTQIAPGRISVIVGPNGAGKSTLLRCMAGLLNPTSGTVLLDKRPVTALSPQARSRALSYLPQSPEIHWGVDVEHLVGLARLPWRGTAYARYDEEVIDSALKRTGLKALAKRTAQRLSGGEQARVHLARILAGEARWALLDEPFAALDLAHMRSAIGLLKEEALMGRGVLLTVHDLTLAAYVADHVLMVKEGTIVAEGPPAEVFNKASLSEIFETPIAVHSDDQGRMTISPDWRD